MKYVYACLSEQRPSVREAEGEAECVCNTGDAWTNRGLPGFAPVWLFACFSVQHCRHRIEAICS